MSSSWTRDARTAGAAAAGALVTLIAAVGPSAAVSARAATWGPVTDLASSPSTSRPDVVVGPRGSATVVWRTQDGVVAISRSAEGRWGDPHRLGNGTAPAAGVDGRGAVTAIWTRHLPGMGPQVMTAHREPGRPWSRAQALSAAVASNGSSFPGAFRPRLAVGHDGSTVVTWMWGADDSGGSRVQARYRPAGGAWRGAALLSPVEARTPEVAVGDDGRAVVVYTVNARVFAVRRSPAGWGAREPVGDHAEPPLVAMDDRGRSTVAWSAFVPGDGTFRPQAVTAVPGGSWSRPMTLDPAGGTHSLPVVGTNQAGRSTVAWTRENGQVVTAARALGGTWTQPQVVAVPGEPLADSPPDLGLVVGRSGAALVTWTRGPAGNHVVEGVHHAAGAGWATPRRLSPLGVDAAAAESFVGPGSDAVAVWRAYDGQRRAHVQVRDLRS